MFNNKDIRSFLKFIIGGGSTTVLMLIVFYGCYHNLHINYLIASVLALTVSIVIGYFVHRYWSFSTVETAHVKHFIRHCIIVANAYVLTVIYMYVLVSLVTLKPFISQLITSTLISGQNFFFYRFWVFQNQKNMVDYSTQNTRP